MKRIIVCMFALMLVFSIVACSSSSEDTEATSAEMEQTAEASDEPNIDVSDDTGIEELFIENEQSVVFDNIFVKLAEQVGAMNYTDCISYLDGTEVKYSAVEPDEDVMGTITIEDNNDFSLNIHFFPDDNGVEIISLVSYSDGNFEGSVSDNCHMSAVTYGTYDITATPSNIDVDSLDTVISFIKNDVPQKRSEYENSVAGNEVIDVDLDVSYEISNGQVFFTVATNLPDETVLMLTLTDGSYRAQTKITIDDGTATSNGFSKEGAQLSGHFTLTVSMSLAMLQPDSVSERIGSQGEFLSGEFVEESSTGGGNVVSGDFEFDF